MSCCLLSEFCKTSMFIAVLKIENLIWPGQGSGGFGTVFCATWRGREVAVKVGFHGRLLTLSSNMLLQSQIITDRCENNCSDTAFGPLKSAQLQLAHLASPVQRPHLSRSLSTGNSDLRFIMLLCFVEVLSVRKHTLDILSCQS